MKWSFTQPMCLLVYLFIYMQSTIVMTHQSCVGENIAYAVNKIEFNAHHFYWSIDYGNFQLGNIMVT